MNSSSRDIVDSSPRRNRLHELLIALINQQRDLELMDEAAPLFENSAHSSSATYQARSLEHNQRVLKKYQSLVRSAIALDALLEAEQC